LFVILHPLIQQYTIMKKIFFFLLVSFTLSSFAQKTEFDKAINQLMHAKNGMLTVENLSKDLSKGIPQDKVAEFNAKMQVLKTNFIQNTVQEFKRKYSTADIREIYAEYTSDKINYSDKTNDFFKFFRHLKGQFYADAKRLYGEYL